MYQQYRHEALRLSRQWQKLMRRAGTAYAAEDHSGQLPDVLHCVAGARLPNVLLAGSFGLHKVALDIRRHPLVPQWGL